MNEMRCYFVRNGDRVESPSLAIALETERELLAPGDQILAEDRRTRLAVYTRDGWMLTRAALAPAIAAYPANVDAQLAKEAAR